MTSANPTLIAMSVTDTPDELSRASAASMRCRRMYSAGVRPDQWAVSGFTEVLAQEVVPLGIRVTAIGPGAMPTGWAEEKDPTLPAGAIQLTSDLGLAAYSGVQPPPGTGLHRLVICVTALGVDTLDVPEGASLALVNILMIGHTLGRGIIVATSQAPGA